MNEILEKKLNEILEAQKQTLANLNALQGAEQVIRQLIQEVTENENDNS